MLLENTQTDTLDEQYHNYVQGVLLLLLEDDAMSVRL